MRGFILILLAGLAVAPMAQAEDVPWRAIAILSAFDPEWQALKAESFTMPGPKPLAATASLPGRWAGKPVVLTLSGVSMVNAAMTTPSV